MEIEVIEELATLFIKLRTIAMLSARTRKLELAIIEQVRFEFLGLKRIMRKNTSSFVIKVLSCAC